MIVGLRDESVGLDFVFGSMIHIYTHVEGVFAYASVYRDSASNKTPRLYVLHKSPRRNGAHMWLQSGEHMARDDDEESTRGRACVLRAAC